MNALRVINDFAFVWQNSITSTDSVEQTHIMSIGGPRETDKFQWRTILYCLEYKLAKDKINLLLETPNLPGDFSCKLNGVSIQPKLSVRERDESSWRNISKSEL